MIWIWSLLATVSAAVSVEELVGTWTTKSQQVLTGPVSTTQNKHTDTKLTGQGFYDPLNDRLIEPDRTGISYSFDADGNYEEAFYRALANRKWIRSTIYTEWKGNGTDAMKPPTPNAQVVFNSGSTAPICYLPMVLSSFTLLQWTVVNCCRNLADRRLARIPDTTTPSTSRYDRL